MASISQPPNNDNHDNLPDVGDAIHLFGPATKPDHPGYPTTALPSSYHHPKSSNRYIYVIPHAELLSQNLSHCPCCLRNVLTDPLYHDATNPTKLRHLVGCRYTSSCIHTPDLPKPRRLRCCLCARDCRKKWHVCRVHDAPDGERGSDPTEPQCKHDTYEVFREEHNRRCGGGTGLELHEREAREREGMQPFLEAMGGAIGELEGRSASEGLNEDQEGYLGELAVLNEEIGGLVKDSKAGMDEYHDVWDRYLGWGSYMKDDDEWGVGGTLVKDLPENWFRPTTSWNMTEEEKRANKPPGA